MLQVTLILLARHVVRRSRKRARAHISTIEGIIVETSRTLAEAVDCRPPSFNIQQDLRNLWYVANAMSATPLCLQQSTYRTQPLCMQLNDAPKITSLDWRRSMSESKNRTGNKRKTSGTTQRQNIQIKSRDMVCDMRILAHGGISIFDRNGMMLGKKP